MIKLTKKSSYGRESHQALFFFFILKFLYFLSHILYPYMGVDVYISYTTKTAVCKYVQI